MPQMSATSSTDDASTNKLRRKSFTTGSIDDKEDSIATAVTDVSGSMQFDSPRSTSRPKSPRAFRSLAHGLRGFARAQVIADQGIPRNLDVTGLIRRIALTLSTHETYQKVVQNLFEKFSVKSPNGSLLPVAVVPDLLAHFGVPQDHMQIFEAVLRKQETYFVTAALPEYISLRELEGILIRVLRRIRDKYCTTKVTRSQFVTHNRRKFDEEYTLLDSCGKGSFGECFWVSHRISRTKRVAKRIPKDESVVPAEEVASELDILKKLDHPNVLRVFEWFETDDAYLLVVEAAHGGDLKHLLLSVRDKVCEAPNISSKHGLEESLVSQLMEQSLRALAYIHSMHVIHRDMKPANLLLASEDLLKPRVLLADFGVAEIFQESHSAIIKGTLGYMAPEVFANVTCHRSDVWAVGIITYELLVGERPFLADNPMAMYARLKRSEVSLEQVKEAGCTKEAATFISKLLQKDPTLRPSAATALSDPWVSEDHYSKTLLSQRRTLKRAPRSFKSFMKRSYFSKAAMNCLAAQLDTNKIEGLNQTFAAFDLDRDGKLTAAELAAGLAEHGVDLDAIDQLVTSIDMDGDGSIQYSEFVASLLMTQGKLLEDVLYHAFHIFDVNGDGSISLEELRVMLSGTGPLAAVLPDGKTVDQVLCEVDTSHDGVITFDEFKDYILKEHHPAEDQEVRKQALERTTSSEENLENVLSQLASAMGRSEADLLVQARRLADEHWISTVSDLHKLGKDDWPRLGLPLKLERVLKNHLGID